ncbi:hypothetical protein [Actinotalea sp. K2]|uniref:hypothetical protein n=1 Tax=Actinotalea sp. K2 TaxID=2939438 RepID=UPI002017F505|nr:hypothetical protein [Actinotalea sp. K2]
MGQRATGGRIRGWLALAVALAAFAVSSGLVGAAPASAALAAYDYDTAAYTYDGLSRLSSPDTAPEDARGSPPGPGAASWASSVSSGGFGVAANTAIDIRPPLSIGSRQFGAKWGKHAADYGLDPASNSARSSFMSRARDAHLNPVEVRRGAWNPAGGGGDNYFFFRQGDDLLVTQPGGEFVTMFPGGSTNAWFKNAEVFPH